MRGLQVNWTTSRKHVANEVAACYGLMMWFRWASKRIWMRYVNDVDHTNNVKSSRERVHALSLNHRTRCFIIQGCSKFNSLSSKYFKFFASITPRIQMCLIVYYSYTCSPSHQETLVQSCHSRTRSEEARNYMTSTLSLNNPFFKSCPKLWERTIHPPFCVGCLMEIEKLWLPWHRSKKPKFLRLVIIVQGIK
jgi:hypothetical protein